MHALSDTLDHDGTIPIAQIETGLLNEAPLRETLQDLALRSKSGTLQIIAGRDTGFIVIEIGAPVRAAFQAVEGDDAVLGMLALDEGRYSFAPGVDEGLGSTTSALTGLLLKDSRRRDESS
jgi:hypothetical protein